MSSAPAANLNLRLANGFSGAILTLAAASSWLQTTPKGSVAQLVASTALAPPRWGHSLWYGLIMLQALCALHQAVGAGYKFDGRKALLVNSTGFYWAAQAIAQAGAALLDLQPPGRAGHLISVAAPLVLLLASLSAGIVCLSRMTPVVQRMREMELKKDDNRSGSAAAPIRIGGAQPQANNAGSKASGATSLASAEVDSATATWLYVSPVSGAVAWSAVAVGAHLVALVTPYIKRQESAEGLCAALALIATVVALLVMHAYQDVMGPATLMTLLLTITVGGHPKMWMPRMMSGALAFMLGMRIAARVLPDES